jgi:hypothetical protein
MPRKPLATVLLVLALGLGAGCDLDDFLDRFGDFDTCSVAQGNTNVAGSWRLTASGSRSSCHDSRFDGDFRIPAVELEVRQVGDALELVTVPQVPGGRFLFSGTVRGTCVDFSAQEEGTTGSFLFVFDGNRDGADVAGEFTGEGPPGCSSRGEFRVRIQ